MKEVEETSFCSFHNSLGKSRIEILRQFSRFFFRFVLNSFLFYGSLSSRKFLTTVFFFFHFFCFSFFEKEASNFFANLYTFSSDCSEHVRYRGIGVSDRSFIYECKENK